MKKYTLVTGASRGIGRELALNFASNGNNLILVARSEDDLKDLAELIENNHQVETKIMTADLSKMGAAKNLLEQIEKKGLTIENLVNNAGFGLFGKFVNIPVEKQIAMTNLNCTALMELMHGLLPKMLENKSGRILNVASTASFEPGPLMATYYASKAYVLFLSEAIAEEISDSGVSITALCPGPTRSSFQKEAHLEDSAMIKNKKLPTAKEVADFGYKACMKGKRVAIHGIKNWFLVQSVRFLPRKMVTKLVKKMTKAI
ncbi:SDR family NAD(P)-dependent oxidoreductase [Candidatus Peregrinibacteria bacterium]|nr:SDR family NAD(P)-dependent oxidoreductase [Candidatus Peregrinibacteria bacterium]